MRPFILADNQDITREGIAALLREAGLAGLLLAAGSRSELLERLGAVPDAAVVLDYTLYDFAGVHEMLNLKAGFGDSSWLLFSDEPGVNFIRQAMGSCPEFNIVMKKESRAEIAEALRCTAAGESYICDFAAQVLREDVPAPFVPVRLTPAEAAVLREIARGKTTKEIAYDKNLSFHTVNSHRKNIFRKLEVNNVHEAIRYAVRAGIVDPAEYYI